MGFYGWIPISLILYIAWAWPYNSKLILNYEKVIYNGYFCNESIEGEIKGNLAKIVDRDGLVFEISNKINIPNKLFYKKICINFDGDQELVNGVNFGEKEISCNPQQSLASGCISLGADNKIEAIPDFAINNSCPNYLSDMQKFGERELKSISIDMYLSPEYPILAFFTFMFVLSILWHSWILLHGRAKSKWIS